MKVQIRATLRGQPRGPATRRRMAEAEEHRVDRRQAVENERNNNGFFCAAQDCLGFPRVGLIVVDAVTGAELERTRVCRDHLPLGGALRGFHGAMGRQVRVQNVVLSSAEPLDTFAARAWPGLPNQLRMPWINSFAEFVAPTTAHFSICGSSGSATFFVVAGAYFMVTASHVLQGVDKHLRPYDHEPDLRRGMGQVHARAVRRSVSLAPMSAIIADWREDDVAVVRLSSKTAQELLGAGIRFLGLENVLLEGPSTVQMIYAGFPENVCQGPFDEPRFFHACLDASHPVMGNQINLALGTPTGRDHVIPHGISGCSMWAVLPGSINDVARLNECAGGKYDAANLLRVVGVQTAYSTGIPNQKDWCVGTKWDSVASSLRVLGGPIAAAIEHHFPGVPVATLNRR